MSRFFGFFRNVGKHFSRRHSRTVADGSEPNPSLDDHGPPSNPPTCAIETPLNLCVEDVVKAIEELVFSSIFGTESKEQFNLGAAPQSQIHVDGPNSDEPPISDSKSQHVDPPEQGIDFTTAEEIEDTEPDVVTSPEIESRANPPLPQGTTQSLLDYYKTDSFSDDSPQNIEPKEFSPDSKVDLTSPTAVRFDQDSSCSECEIHAESLTHNSEIHIEKTIQNQSAANQSTLEQSLLSAKTNDVALLKQAAKSGSTEDMLSGSERSAPSPKLLQLPQTSTSLRHYLERTSVQRPSSSPLNVPSPNRPVVAERKQPTSASRTPPKQAVTTEKSVAVARVAQNTISKPPSPRPSTPTTSRTQHEPAAKVRAKEPEECPHKEDTQDGPSTTAEEVSLIALTEVSDSTKDVLETAMRKFGMKETTVEGHWNVRWSDNGIPIHLFQKLLKYQRINRFPGSGLLMTKNNLAKNTSKMKQTFPEDYDFVPETWCLPGDFTRVELYAKAHDRDCFIVKPNDGSSGRGIIITRNVTKLRSCDKMVCQVYIRKPFLIDGYKFDLRIYTLITSCRPLRLFVYNEGLARFATEKYQEPNAQNEGNRYMHLTNYAVNKRSPLYTVDETKGTLRRLSTINKWLARHNFDSKKVWDSMDEAIVKTIISFLPALRHYYKVSFPDQFESNSCFQVMGFDIIFDEKLKPYVLEVNDSPSFKADVPLDKEMTDALIHDTFNILHLNENNRSKVLMEEKRQSRMRLMSSTTQNKTNLHKEKEQSQRQLTQSRIEWENSHMGNFRKVFPNEGKMKHYKKFIRAAHEIFQNHPW